MDWRLDSSLTQTGSAALYQCDRPFLFVIPYLLFIHTHIIPMYLDQFVAHCLDIIDIQLCCGMGFEHGSHIFFFTIHFPLLLEPCLSTNPSSRRSFIIFWTCFLVRLNSSISLTCVIVDSSFILCKISHFFSAPFFGSFLFTLFLFLSQKYFMHK